MRHGTEDPEMNKYLKVALMLAVIGVLVVAFLGFILIPWGGW